MTPESVKSLRIVAVVAVSVFLLASACAQEVNEIRVEGVYSNYDYAYAVKLPVGLVGFRDAPPSPNHGFGVRLDTAGSSYLWIDASHNSQLWQSLTEAVDSSITFPEEDSVSHVTVVNRKSTRLATLPAYRVTMTYTDKHGVSMVQEMVLAMRQLTHGNDIVYTICLRAHVSRADRDRAVFDKLKDAFVLKRLPK